MGTVNLLLIDGGLNSSEATTLRPRREWEANDVVSERALSHPKSKRAKM